jgi:uncharacterized protein YbbC (DUF1343 family)
VHIPRGLHLLCSMKNLAKKHSHVFEHFALLVIALIITVASTTNVLALRARVYPTPAAENTNAYFPKLEGKKIALVVNQTSMLRGEHLVDGMLDAGINVVKIFAPEHGFRGTGDAGEKLKDSKDAQTGISISSLYGDKKKPTSADLAGIDMMVFDIQDVGVRFYTYISTLQYIMEACAENNIPLLVLDRPNPNGNYIDGPILENKHKSFVGLQAIPIVYGMTIGEYAKMLNGEKLLAKGAQCDLTVLPCKDYTHASEYVLPIAPSPNLNSHTGILLYPSLCFFEGTDVSVGRGTAQPFTQWGHPSFTKMKYNFTPKATVGNKKPLHLDKVCYGENLLANKEIKLLRQAERINITYLQSAYKSSGLKDKFFNDFFVKLAGTENLQKQIMAGKTEKEIRASWKPGIDKFKKIRKKYLLYPDFE